MFCKTFLNISKNAKILMPSVPIRINRTFISCEEDNVKNDNKNDSMTLNSDLENAINDQINKELSGAYANIAMAEYFERPNVSLPGFAKAHTNEVEDDLRVVNQLIKLLSQRGGKLSLKAIEPPDNKEWQSAIDVVRSALQMEKSTAQSLMNLANLATQVQDHYVSSIINSSLMVEQIEIINELEQRQAKLELCSSPNCLLLLDGFLNKKN